MGQPFQFGKHQGMSVNVCLSPFQNKNKKRIWCGQMLREIVTYRKGRAKAIEFLEDLKGKIIFFLANGKHKNFWLKKNV